MIENIVVGYVIVQLLSTAFGLAVIESVREVAVDKLHSEGYVRKNRHSLYKFSDTLSNVAKGFIPFYYFIKSLSLIGNKQAVDKTMNAEINKGNYVKVEDIVKQLNAEVQVIEEPANDISLKPETEIIFEKPEKYKARKIDNTVFDNNQTPIEYIEHEVEKDNELEITPFKTEEQVVEHVIVKEDASAEDIAAAISKLSEKGLDSLIETAKELKRIKAKNKSLELKDVA